MHYSTGDATAHPRSCFCFSLWVAQEAPLLTNSIDAELYALKARSRKIRSGAPRIVKGKVVIGKGGNVPNLGYVAPESIKNLEARTRACPTSPAS
jgi:hypothetical protein